MSITPEHIQQAVDVARSYGATRVILFGSAVTSPETARDLDVAVEGVNGWSFYGLVGEMMMQMPIPVDVVALEDAAGSVLEGEIRRFGRVLLDLTPSVSHAA